ncbi:SMI1/KNR4 family protein [Oscillospiraceae bacterium 38-13]
MMTPAEQRAFIKTGMETLYRALEAEHPIFTRMCGVPEAMRAGPVDSDGWCRWKLIPSPVTAEDLDRQEQAAGCPFPSLLRTFFSTCCHYFDDAGLGRHTPDEPFFNLDQSWNPTLVRAGYLPFLWDEEGYFLRCIDLANMPDEDRCPVVQIGHEVLFDLPEDTGRDALNDKMEPVSPSFQAFLEEIFSGWLEKQGRNLARRYLDGLREAYEDADAGELWEAFASVAHGASEEDLAALKALYPELPASLETLLRFADGTYYREYRPGEKTCFYLLGSDVEEYPYYLLSARQMLETRNDVSKWGNSLIRRKFEDIPVDGRITDDPEHLRWLHFSDCMNNGGTSRLFLDFTPSETGKAGQVVRFLHDPDGLEVIAGSFDGYLKLLMENEYDFINEDSVEE